MSKGIKHVLMPFMPSVNQNAEIIVGFLPIEKRTELGLDFPAKPIFIKHFTIAHLKIKK